MDANFPQANQNNDLAYSNKWQAVGAGSVANPSGSQYSETELMSYYATLHPTTETYVWAKAATYYVDFSENKPGGVTNAVVNLPNTIQQYVTQDAVVPTQVPTLADYTFKGYKWGTQDVVPGDTIPMQTADIHVTLVAQWERIVTYYYVDFSENKPVGVTDAVQSLPSTIQQDTIQDAVVPTQIPTLAGYIFKGYKWGNTDVAPGDTIAKQVADTHVTLEAQWEKIASVTPPATTAPATNHTSYDNACYHYTGSHYTCYDHA